MRVLETGCGADSRSRINRIISPAQSHEICPAAAIRDEKARTYGALRISAIRLKTQGLLAKSWQLSLENARQESVVSRPAMPEKAQ